MSTRLRDTPAQPFTESSPPRDSEPVAVPHNQLDFKERLIVVAPCRYVLLPLAALITGYTFKAMQRKIERNDWREQREYRRAPDGHVMLDVTGYENWVLSGRRARR